MSVEGIYVISERATWDTPGGGGSVHQVPD